MTDKIIPEALSIMENREPGEIIRAISDHYWPGSMTWDEICNTIRSWSDGPISRDEAYEVMQISGILGVFMRREEKRVSERDTKFAGFAEVAAKKLLVWDLHTVEGLQEFKRVLAQCAYDLACYVVSETVGAGSTVEGLLSAAPDLTELPEDDTNASSDQK